MGSLHAGHAQLMRAACSAGSASVLVSIFVNPLQFGPGEDFDRYPRSLNADLALAESCGVGAVWVPAVDALYPKGFRNVFRLQVPDGLQRHLCGSRRPGHFDGVATVVARLLALVQP